MSLSLEYLFLIAAATYLWIFVPLAITFQLAINSLDYNEKRIYKYKEEFWIISTSLFCLMLLL